MVTMAITKTVSIARSPEAVFDFLANPANWPKWAVVNVQSATPLDGDWWLIQTPLGAGKLRLRAERALGILDHDFLAPGGAWNVPARVVPNRLGAEFMITFFKPDEMSEEIFQQQVDQVDRELVTLKEVLENRRESQAA